GAGHGRTLCRRPWRAGDLRASQGHARGSRRADAGAGAAPVIWRILSWVVVLAVPALWLSRFFISGPGLSVFSGLMVYLVAWWIVLFAILPIGVRGQFEDGDVIAGSEPGAPSTPDLKRKAWW